MAVGQKELAKTLAALGYEVRLRILAQLRGKTCCVSDISAALKMGQPATSHHLTSLRNAGLVDFDRDGKFNRYRLTPLAADLVPAAEKIVGKHAEGGAR